MIKLINGDAFKEIYSLDLFEMCFIDPPDNINLSYNSYNDNLPEKEYLRNIDTLINVIAAKCQVIWLSFNAKYTFSMGRIFERFLSSEPIWEGKPCVQTFTFGQHNKHDLGNNHRPLWRLRNKYAPLYPDAIRVPSWRLLNGDKRANPDGRVPGDVFNIPRITGNGKQRRSWHPTQLHEDLVERCIKLTTHPSDHVIDLFAGTGTTLRVCKRLGNPCTLVEIDPYYCSKIADENQLKQISEGIWSDET